MDARVEAYVDDALPPTEQIRFEARLWADPHWQEQVERARSIRGSLRSQSPPPAPTELTTAILSYVSSSPAAKTEPQAK
jgi:anti-sigma factor RsiW